MDKRCILKEAFCDNHYDCDDKSDEPEGCISRIKRKNKCPADHFDCKDGNCIKMEWKCDGRVDCVSGDDEKTCTSSGFKFDVLKFLLFALVLFQ